MIERKKGSGLRAAMFSAVLIAALFAGSVWPPAGLPFARAGEDSRLFREEFASDEGRVENFIHGFMTSHRHHVLRKLFHLPRDPGSIEEAAVRYYIPVDPYDRKTRRHFSRPEEGIEWPDLQIKVNGKIAASGPLIELAAKGWHTVDIDPALLREGENRVFMRMDGEGAYFYPAIDPTFHRGYSAISRDGGETFDDENLSRRTDRTQRGEFVIRLITFSREGRKGEFLEKEDDLYLWIELADLFFDRRIEGWQAREWTLGQNLPSRGLTAHVVGEAEIDIPLEITEGGEYHFWLRGWTDGEHGGYFKVSLVDDILETDMIVDSRETGIAFTGDADIKFEWMRGSSLVLGPGSYSVNIETFVRTGHMFDVLVVTTDGDYKPDVSSPLPAANYPKLFGVEASFADMAPGDYFIEPCVRWANPLHGGSLRSLWLTPNVHKRDILELGRRLDMETDVLAYKNPVGSFPMPGGDVPQDRIFMLEEVLESDEEWDILVMVKTPADSVPPRVQELIEKRVSGGMGLLILDSGREFDPVGFLGEQLEAGKTCPDEHRLMKSAAGLLSLEVELSEFYREHGEGRIVIMPHMVWAFLDLHGHDEGPLHTMADKLYGAWGKLALSAAGRDKNPLRIEDINITGKGRDKEWLEIDVRNFSGDGMEASVTAIIEGPAGERMTLLEKFPRLLGAGELSAVSADMPEFKTAGGYLVYIIVESEEGACDFALKEFRKETDLEILSMVPGKELFAPGEDLDVILEFENRSPYDTEASIELKVFGSFNRLTGRREANLDIPAGRSEQAFSIRTIENSDWQARIEAFVTPVNGEAVSVYDCDVFIRRRSCFDDFNVAAVIKWYPYLPPQHTRAMTRKWHDFGVTAIDKAGPRNETSEFGMRFWNPWHLSRSGHLSYVDGVKESSVFPGRKARIDCFHEPGFWEGETDSIEGAVKRNEHRSPLILGIADEIRLGERRVPELCWSPYTMDAFREHARKKYDSLSELNEAWETDYASWESVVPWTGEEAVRRVSNIAPWLEFRSFLTRALVDYIEGAQEIAKKTAPFIPTGAVNPWNEDYLTCVAFEKLFPVMDVSEVYPRFFDQARSFFRDSGLVGTWTGYTRDEQRVADECWLVPAYGGAYVAFYGLHQEYPEAQSGTLRWTGRSLAVGETLKELTRGKARLLMEAARKEPDVGILKNYKSRYAHTVWKSDAASVDLRRAAGAYDSLVTGYTDILQGFGMDYDFLDSEKAGSNLLDGYRVIFAPGITVASDSLLERLTGFAEGGGVLVADETLGIYDEAGKKRDNAPALSAEFDRENIVILDPLNVTGNDLGPVLEEAGAMPEYRFGGEGRITRAVCRGLDGMEILILFGEGDMKAKFPERRHIYDARSQSYLGYTAEAPVRPDLGPAVLVSLPGAISDIALDVPRYVSQGANLEFSGKVKAGGQDISTVLRVEVFKPGGEAARAYGNNIRVKNGEFSGSFVMAFNDEPGEWRIRVSEVVSGKILEKTFEVSKRR